MRKKTFIILIFLFCVEVAIGGHFAIIGSDKIVQGSNYNAVLSANGDIEQLEVAVKTDSNKQLYSNKFKLSRNSLEAITFQVPDDVNLSFIEILTKKNSDNEISRKIHVTAKYNVIIQTDKRVYRQGDTLQFSVVVVDAKMLPYQFNSMKILIQSEKNVKLFEKNYQKKNPKIIEDSIELGNDVNFGKWKIRVKIDNEKSEKIHNFQVGDYLLPDFEFFVKPGTRHSWLSREVMNVDYHVEFLSETGSDLPKGNFSFEAATFDPVDLTSPLKNLKTDSTVLKFSDLGIGSNHSKVILRLQGKFEDERSLISYSPIEMVEIHKNQFITEEEFLTPGETFKLIYFSQSSYFEKKDIKVREQKLKDQTLNFETSNLEWTTRKDQWTASMHGVYEINIDTSINTAALEISVANKDVHKVFRFANENKDALELNISPESPKVGNQVCVLAKFIPQPVILYTIVIGKNGIIERKRTENSNKSCFKVTEKMLPSSKIFVYFQRDDGSVVSNHIKLEDSQNTENFLNIEAPSSVEPGEKIEIKLTTKPHSTIMIRAVDFVNSRENFRFESSQKRNENVADVLILGNSGSSVINSLSSQIFGFDDISENLQPSDVWFFKSYEADASGKFCFEIEAPESFKSYEISGISINSDYKLAVSKPKIVEVSKDFFIEIETPKSIYLNEVLTFRIKTFSKRYSNQDTKIELIEGSGFEIIYGQSAFFWKSAVNILSRNYLSKGSQEGYFSIRALRRGDLVLKVKAQTGSKIHEASNTIVVERMILETSVDEGRFFDLRYKEFDGYYTEIPKNDALESISLEVSVIGNFIRKSLDNLDRFLNPQKDLKNSPVQKFVSVFALNYMKSQKYLEKARVNPSQTLTSIYQSINEYKKPNGAYSYPGKGEIESTALVVKFMSFVKDWIDIGRMNLENALKAVMSSQKPTGYFQSENKNEMSDIWLTAFAAILVYESKHSDKTPFSKIDKSLRFIDGKFRFIQKNSELAICAYAFALGQRPEQADKFLKKLMENENKHGNKFWETEDERNNIETAAYSVLALMNREKIIECSEIAFWLDSQDISTRNDLDARAVLVGLQALAELSRHTFSDKFDLTVVVNEKTFNINQDNANELQTSKINQADDASINLNGTGIAYVHISRKYKNEIDNKSFKIEVSHEKNSKILTIKLTVSYVGQFENSKNSEAEIKLPRGYKFKSISGEWKTETRAEKTIVKIFFGSMSKNKIISAHITTYQWYEVSGNVPYHVIISDDKDKSTTTEKYVYIT